jgi:1-acyl-sn-glycerol-3-phosphate acyltransferase
MFDQGQDRFSVHLIRGSLLLAMRLLFRIEHYGMENIPERGPLIITSNHVTYFDPFWVSVRIYRAVRFMAWDKIFSFPIAGAIFRWLGAFPVNLEAPEFGAYKNALAILKKQEALMIFPEGGRSPDGNLMPFKEGAARLALKTGAPILPVLVEGGERVWSAKMHIPRPRKVVVSYLRLIHTPSIPAGNRDEFEKAAVALTRQIHDTLEAALRQTPRLRARCVQSGGARGQV